MASVESATSDQPLNNEELEELCRHINSKHRVRNYMLDLLTVFVFRNPRDTIKICLRTMSVECSVNTLGTFNVMPSLQLLWKSVSGKWLRFSTVKLMNR